MNKKIIFIGSVIIISSCALQRIKYNNPLYFEKCYNILKQPFHECSSHSPYCSNDSDYKRYKSDYILLPKGDCLQIKGGSLYPTTEALHIIHKINNIK